MFQTIVLYIAHSLEEQGSLRQLLEAEGISFSVSAKDTHAPKGFYPVLSPALLVTQTIEYIFYVGKKEYARAAALLEEKWVWCEEEWEDDDET